MKFLIISAGWLGLCAIAGVWAYRRAKKADLLADRIEADWDEALLMDKWWNEERFPVGLPPVKRPVPPILNQSDYWQQNARVSEGNDDDWDRGDAA